MSRLPPRKKSFSFPWTTALFGQNSSRSAAGTAVFLSCLLQLLLLPHKTPALVSAPSVLSSTIAAGSGGTGCRTDRTNDGVLSWRSVEEIRRGNIDYTYRSSRRRRRVGAGELQAALEVFPATRLEPGCVLWASPENYGHSTFRSVILVYEHGEGIDTKAVVVDKGLEFTIGEMSSGDLGPLSDNRLFRGGEDGGEAAIMIHEYDIPGSRPLGDSGLYTGGFQAAMTLVSKGAAGAKDFKFFFNYMVWSEGTVEDQVRKGQWKLLKLPNKVLLDDKRMRDMELWGRVEHFMEKEGKQ